MLKFPQLLILPIVLAVQARAELWPAESSTHRTTAPVVASAISAANVAVPEPGVFVALLSGAAMLLARRRR